MTAARARRTLRLVIVAVAFVIGVPGMVGAQDQSPRVLLTTIDAPITPVVAEHIASAIRQAERGRYDAVVIEIDTPGGLDLSMRRIIQRILGAEVPVIAFVSPAGSRAASAGAIITYAAHVAAMAPGTAIGAATPVDLQGGDVEQKIISDAAAFAEALARLRDRNVEFAVASVTEARSASANEALQLSVVDLIAGSRSDLLAQADGRTVVVGQAEREFTLRTAGATVDIYEMGFFRRIQQRLADPNLAFLFMSLGTLALIYELASPGVGVGGVAGVVMIILALFALSVLPVNTVGILFMLLAGALFVAELFAPGIGVAAAGGAGALLLSGIFLFRDAPGMSVSLGVVVPIAVVVGGAVVLAGRLVVRTRKAPSRTTGAGLYVGRKVVVGRASGPRGQAHVDGTWWTVRSTGPDLVEGATVRVVKVDGLDLVVDAGSQSTSEGES